MTGAEPGRAEEQGRGAAAAAAAAGALITRVTGFSRSLRAAGVAAGPQATADAIASLCHVNPADPAQFYTVLQANLIGDVRDIPAFDAVFRGYFHGGGPADDTGLHVTVTGAAEQDPAPPDDEADRAAADVAEVPAPGPGDQHGDQQDTDDDDGRPPGSTGQGPDVAAEPDEADSDLDAAAYSPLEVLVRKDFAALDPAELRRVHRLIDMLESVPPMAPTRRYDRTASPGAQLHFRETWRRFVAQGDAVELVWRRQRRRRRKLVLLCDVSRSMEGYGGPLLHFAYVLCRRLAGSEVFTFSTRLTRITPLLRSGTQREVLAALADETLAWSSGTSIGRCFAEFNRRRDEFGVDSRVITVIISDGWECGEIELLREEMAALKRRCHAVVWLNPAMSDPRYSPDTAGMRAALRYADFLLPCHNLASLREFVARLAAL